MHRHSHTHTFTHASFEGSYPAKDEDMCLGFRLPCGGSGVGRIHYIGLNSNSCKRVTIKTALKENVKEDERIRDGDERRESAEEK